MSPIPPDGDTGGGGGGGVTEAEVDAKIAAVVDMAPTTLDTLNELAAALGDNPTFATDIQQDLSDHINDGTDAHMAASIGVVDAEGVLQGGDVESALNELYHVAADSEIDGDRIASNSIMLGKLASNSVDQNAIASGAVGFDEIQDGNIIRTKIGGGQIDAYHMRVPRVIDEDDAIADVNGIVHTLTIADYTGSGQHGLPQAAGYSFQLAILNTVTDATLNLFDNTETWFGEASSSTILTPGLHAIWNDPNEGAVWHHVLIAPSV